MFTHRSFICAAMAIVLSFACSDALAQTAFPGALGFGANATGGRAGTVYRVTTLADSGAGSFRDAVSQPNRIVIFAVGGYVTLQSGVSVRENITIAGQTAPGGGIGFKGDEISFGTRNNIICRHIRVRPGSETDSNNDVGISLYNARNVILDHVSIEFAPWNNVGAVSDDWQNKPVTDVTFQNCLNANPTYQQFGAHTESVSSTMAWFYTLFANSHNRNPMSKINDVFVNNVLYNCSAGYTTHTSTAFDHDIVNNYFIAGPASGGNLPWYQVDNDQSIYYSGNYYDSDKNGVLGGGITIPTFYQGPPGGTILGTPWSSLTSTSILYSARAAYRITVSQAGAFPRDQMDDLVINQVKTLGNGITGTGVGTTGPDGGLYTSQTQTGLPNNGYGIINGGTLPQDTDGDGMPDYFEQASGYNLGSPDAMLLGGDGYARIEKFINWLAEPHASTSTNAPVAIDLWQFTTGFTNDAPVYSVNNAVNGTVTISNSHFAVFTPTASFIGLGSFRFTVNSADGSSYTNTVGIAISALQPPKNLIWQGDGAANIWTNAGPLNWLNAATPVSFNAGDNITFDDSGSASPAINLAAPLAPGAMAFVAAQDYTIGGSGALTGNGSLYKVGQGKLTLNTLNTFSGGTTINEGIVQLGDGISLNGSISGNITNNDTLILATSGSVTSLASVHGSGEVIKRGAGNHTLSGTQTYTNLTTIEAGTLTFAGTPPTGVISNAGSIGLNLSASSTYTGFVTGPGTVNINASGQTTTLNTTNTYSGGTTNNNGTLQLGNNSAIGTGPITYLAGAIKINNGIVITNTFILPSSTADLMMDSYGNGTSTWAGDIVLGVGGASFRPGGTAGTLVLTGTGVLGARNLIVPRGTVEFGGNANFSASGATVSFGRNTTQNSSTTRFKQNAVGTFGPVSLGGGTASGGTLTLQIQDNASFSTGLSSFDIHNSTAAAAITVLNLNGGTFTTGGFVKTRTGATQYSTNSFNGGILRASQINFSFIPALNGLTCLVRGGGAKIDANGFTIAIWSPLIHDPSLATMDGGLTKLGSGMLQIMSTCTFNGPTTINAGTLMIHVGSISNTTSIQIAAGAILDFSALPNQTLNSGRKLWGNGTVIGNLTLGNGAILDPGTNAIGKLTFNNPLTLVAGCSNLFELNKAASTNDVLERLGSVSFNGTLVVTNLSGTLTAGDSFKLFNALSYSGSFSTVMLPALDAGLAWNTSQLNTAGIIAVVSTAPANPPIFGAVSTSGNNLVMSGSNGTPNASFYTLTATNVTLPVASWSRVATNQFDANGYFNLTNPVDPLTPQLYYRLQLP